MRKPSAFHMILTGTAVLVVGFVLVLRQVSGPPPPQWVIVQQATLHFDLQAPPPAGRAVGSPDLPR